ncbi:hypothetical protein AB6G07_20000, partial [Providencia stuartii]|uniref:hypothetical protein n=1 Tax=Providencia stuartii TaxID=588 RepID=UPI0034DCD272
GIRTADTADPATGTETKSWVQYRFLTDKTASSHKQVCDFHRFGDENRTKKWNVKNALKRHRNRCKLSAWFWVFYRVIVS